MPAKRERPEGISAWHVGSNELEGGRRSVQCFEVRRNRRRWIFLDRPVVEEGNRLAAVRSVYFSGKKNKTAVARARSNSKKEGRKRRKRKVKWLNNKKQHRQYIKQAEFSKTHANQDKSATRETVKCKRVSILTGPNGGERAMCLQREAAGERKGEIN